LGEGHVEKLKLEKMKVERGEQNARPRTTDYGTKGEDAETLTRLNAESGE
jgi:hypothetical protein